MPAPTVTPGLLSASWCAKKLLSSGTTRKAEPARGEEDASPEKWSRREDEREEWPGTGPLAALPVTAGQALLYQAAAARLDREDASLEMLLPGSHGLARLVLRAGEEMTVDADHVRTSGNGATRVKGPVAARRVTVEVGEAGDSPAEAVDVLGMEGDVEMLLEIGTGIPLEVRGAVPGLGRLTVRLARIEP